MKIEKTEKVYLDRQEYIRVYFGETNVFEDVISEDYDDWKVALGHEDMTPAELCKAAGLKSLAELAEIVGQHEQTIRRWPKTKPLLWAAILRDAVRTKREREGV